MATIEEVLRTMNAHLAEMDEPELTTATEFLRNQEVLIAERFGIRRPVFRTSIALRFKGRIERTHDLITKIGTSTIDNMTEMIEQAGIQLSGVRGPIKVFLSPQVSPGSTVLTLFGEPRHEVPNQEMLATGIADTPLDLAMNLVFSSINVATAANETSRPSAAELSGPMGKKLYAFTKELLSHDVDLDLIWIKPSGKTSIESIPRERASHIKTVLDAHTEVTHRRDEIGALEQISINGNFKLRLERGHRKTVDLTAPIGLQEELRALWGKRVRVVYDETIVSHPQRDFDDPTYKFISIYEAPDHPQPTLDSE